jgi:hypothetical protein
MGINATKSKNSGNGPAIAPLEAGGYPARLVAVVDVGLQPTSYNGEAKDPAYQIVTTYELADEFLKDEDGDDIPDKPRWVSETFSLYDLSSEKAKSTKRYNVLDPSHENNGNWADLIGAPVLVTLVQSEGKGANSGKTYNNIGGTAPLRAKDVAKLPELVNGGYVFDLDAPDLEVFNKLPAWMQKKIKESLEFPGSRLAKLLEAQPKNADEGAKPVKKTKPAQTEEEEDDSDNPY